MTMSSGWNTQAFYQDNCSASTLPVPLPPIPATEPAADGYSLLCGGVAIIEDAFVNLKDIPHWLNVSIFSFQGQ